MYISPTDTFHYEYSTFYHSNPIFLDQPEVKNEDTPHLILHFDLNKTLIASDRAGQKTARDVVCAEIAEQVIDLWDESISVPISYADYVKQHLLPNPDPSEEIKMKQKVKFSEVLLMLEERNHPDLARMQEIHDRALELLEKQGSQIFTSFYRLIEYLHNQHISYTLVIRTFGSEAWEIAEELNKRFGDDFLADFRALKQGHLQGSKPNLYDLIAEADHHLVIQDDWNWWHEHGQNWRYGKPFPIDLNDPQRISLFFDDNAKPNLLSPQENIIFPYDVVNGNPISPYELIKQGRLIPVEMLGALCDEDYYIRLVEGFMKN